jgi:hypothetical protein
MIGQFEMGRWAVLQTGLRAGFMSRLGAGILGLNLISTAAIHAGPVALGTIPIPKIGKFKDELAYVFGLTRHCCTALGAPYLN